MYLAARIIFLPTWALVWQTLRWSLVDDQGFYKPIGDDRNPLEESPASTGEKRSVLGICLSSYADLAMFMVVKGGWVLQFHGVQNSGVWVLSDMAKVRAWPDYFLVQWWKSLNLLHKKETWESGKPSNPPFPKKNPGMVCIVSHFKLEGVLLSLNHHCSKTNWTHLFKVGAHQLCLLAKQKNMTIHISLSTINHGNHGKPSEDRPNFL